MKKLTALKRSLKIAALAIASLTLHQQTYAQVQVAELMRAGVDDVSTLIKAYTTPLFKGFGTGLNGGWYNTAKTHGLGRFDITFNLNLCLVPNVDKTYDASALGFKTLTLANPANKIGQTISGSLLPTNNPIYVLSLDNPTTPDPTDKVEVANFSAPAGVSLPISGAPTLQASVGLIKNTEVMVRYMPSISLGDMDMGLMGFGLKHDIKQWIPVVSKLPFDMSAYFGYTKLNVDVALDLKADAGVTNQTGNNGNYDPQSMNLETKATTFGLILSKKLLMLTFYGAANYQTSTTNVMLKGDFPVNTLETRTGDPNQGSKVVSKVTNPVNFNVDGANGMSATLGARLKLLIMTIQAGYTFSAYPMATVGIGLNIDLK